MTRKLLSIRLGSLLGSLTGKDGKRLSRGKLLLIALLYAFLGVCFAFFSLAMAMTFAPVMVELGLGRLYFTMFNIAAFTIIFIFSIFETKAMLFECRDNELLLSMPIKVRSIIVSRIFSVVIINYVEAAIILLPAIIVFAAYGGGIQALLGSLIVLLLLPLLATALSSFFGYLVALISSRLKKNSFITLGLYLVFFALYFVLYYGFIGGMTGMEEDPTASIGELNSTFGALGIIGEASMLMPLPLLLLFAITVISALLVYVFISRCYIAIITKNNSREKKRGKARHTERSSAYSALARKEYSRLFSSATYMMNAGIGLIFEVVAAVMLFVYSEEVTVILSQLCLGFGLPYEEVVPAYAICALSILSSTVMISASALSLEGRSYWILRSSPVNALDVILAKLTPHVVISCSTSLVCSALVCMSLEVKPIYIPFVILIPILVNLMYALFGLIMNIAMPKFDFENDAQIVKQSGASTISMLGGMLFSILFLALTVGLSLVSGLLALCISSVFVILLDAILIFVITGPSLRRLKQI